MTYRKGIVSTSVIAGPIEPTHLPARDDIGKGFNMGDHFSFHIRPETARKWIRALTPIAESENNA